MDITQESRGIRILIADDDETILDCYRKAFGDAEQTDYMAALDSLEAELFEPLPEAASAPRFNVVEIGRAHV